MGDTFRRERVEPDRSNPCWDGHDYVFQKEETCQIDSEVVEHWTHDEVPTCSDYEIRTRNHRVERTEKRVLLAKFSYYKCSRCGAKTEHQGDSWWVSEG